ncbi:MAG: AMP-binding protein [Candidatus Sedimenticola endophacoides]
MPNSVGHARGEKQVLIIGRLRVLALSRWIGRQGEEGRNIGLLLPTSSAGLMANAAALLRGRTLVNLNYSAGAEALGAALERCAITTVYTSRRFLERLGRRGVSLDGLPDGVRMVYLEDFRERTGRASALLHWLLGRLLPARLLLRLYGRRVAIDAPAAILFSSGSEGRPKGVVLSHRNLMGNIRQISDVLDTREEDRIMATLPLFHAFGLTVTGLLPLVEGVPAICHPDPTDVLNIAKAVARQRATLFFATSTFLRLFLRNRRVHPAMLESLRLVVAGAERLAPEVRAAFEGRFRIPVFEGYGATETSPVASVNLPDRIERRGWTVQRGGKEGSVGMPLPGSSFRVVDPESLRTLPSGEEGLILIGGPQVMRGYLDDAERSASALVELDGTRWYKTGDKGRMDRDGFLTIVDRYSRFAKIGGEMISLGAVESAIGAALPESVEVMACALPDGRKGERVVLLHAGSIDREGLQERIAGCGLPPLMRPSYLIAMDGIPKLSSGKGDFKRATALAAEALAEEGTA